MHVLSISLKRQPCQFLSGGGEGLIHCCKRVGLVALHLDNHIEDVVVVLWYERDAVVTILHGVVHSRVHIVVGNDTTHLRGLLAILRGHHIGILTAHVVASARLFADELHARQWLCILVHDTETQDAERHRVKTHATHPRLFLALPVYTIVSTRPGHRSCHTHATHLRQTGQTVTHDLIAVLVHAQ